MAPGTRRPVREVAGKTAFVTGGASGLGLGMARAFVDAGMRVVLADLRPEAIATALEHFADARDRVHGLRLDVTDRAAMAAAADESERVFGKVHLLCNNAGVGIMGPIQSATYDDWDWMLGVMLGGTVNGVQTFLPRMLKHGEGGHVLNTASFSGVFVSGNNGIYTTAKFGVVGMAEALRAELVDQNIGVSVFLAGPSRTNLPASASLRPAHHTSGYAVPTADTDNPMLRALAKRPQIMMDPFLAGRRVLRGIQRNDLYIITHPEFRAGLESRAQALLRAVPKERVDAVRRTVLSGLTDSPIYAAQEDVPGFEE
jgi:NAD(P)-dependent dehydrogenase (short-subunit alcohol dehydrogenase family)